MLSRPGNRLQLRTANFSWAVAILEQLSPLFVIPMENLSAREAIAVMRDSVATTQLAEKACAKIPDASEAMRGLIDDYKTSDAAKRSEERRVGKECRYR